MFHHHHHHHHIIIATQNTCPDRHTLTVRPSLLLYAISLASSTFSQTTSLPTQNWMAFYKYITITSITKHHWMRVKWNWNTVTCHIHLSLCHHHVCYYTECKLNTKMQHEVELHMTLHCPAFQDMNYQMSTCPNQSMPLQTDPKFIATNYVCISLNTSWCHLL